LSIDPVDPATRGDLHAAIEQEAEDPDHGQDVKSRYAWSQDGATVSDLDGDTVPADRTAKGETWRVTVTPSDGKETGRAGHADVVVLDRPPTATATVGRAHQPGRHHLRGLHR